MFVSVKKKKKHDSKRDESFIEVFLCHYQLQPYPLPAGTHPVGGPLKFTG